MSGEERCPRCGGVITTEPWQPYVPGEERAYQWCDTCESRTWISREVPIAPQETSP